MMILILVSIFVLTFIYITRLIIKHYINSNEPIVDIEESTYDVDTPVTVQSFDLPEVKPTIETEQPSPSPVKKSRSKNKPKDSSDKKSKSVKATPSKKAAKKVAKKEPKKGKK